MYLINRGPSVPLNCEISEEVRTEKEVNLNHLRTFGCISYVYVELDRRRKLDSKSKRCIFIGYGISMYDYRFEIWKTERSLDIIIWYSMRGRCKRTCWWRGALQRRISEWHLRVLQSTRAVLRIWSLLNFMCSYIEDLEHSKRERGIWVESPTP